MTERIWRLSYTVDKAKEREQTRGSGQLPSATTTGMIKLYERDEISIRHGVLFVNTMRIHAIEHLSIDEFK